MIIDVASPIVGLVMPIVIDLVNRIFKMQDKSKEIHYLVSLAVSGLAGLVIVALNLRATGVTINLAILVANIAVVFTFAQSVYKLYYETSTARTIVQGEVAK